MTPSPVVAAITGTGLWNAPDVITNDELVTSFNEYVRRQNQRNAKEIACGEAVALEPSSVEFIEKASGIRQRYVLDRQGVLDPERMRPYFAPRPNEELSLQVEIALGAARDALAMARREAADIDMVIVACANMERSYPAIAIEVQGALGIVGFGFDMLVACSAATFALQRRPTRCGRQCARRAGDQSGAHVAAGELLRPRQPLHLRRRRNRSGARTRVDVRFAAPATRILGTKAVTQFSNNIRSISAMSAAPKAAILMTQKGCSVRTAGRCSRKSVRWRLRISKRRSLLSVSA